MVGAYTSPGPYAGSGAGGYGGDDDGRLLGDGEPPRLRLSEFLRQTVERINQMVADLRTAGVSEGVAA